jgi:hypothetical protein
MYTNSVRAGIHRTLVVRFTLPGILLLVPQNKYPCSARETPFVWFHVLLCWFAARTAGGRGAREPCVSGSAARVAGCEARRAQPHSGCCACHRESMEALLGRGRSLPTVASMMRALTRNRNAGEMIVSCENFPEWRAGGEMTKTAEDVTRPRPDSQQQASGGGSGGCSLFSFSADQ